MGAERGIFPALAVALVLVPAPARAQDSLQLHGQWRGDVTETIDGRAQPYRMFVAIDADREGRPVASVSYSLECRGVWTGAERRGRVWHFAETITAGRRNCASHVEVEIEREGIGLRIRLHPVGHPEQVTVGVLQRLNAHPVFPDPAAGRPR